MRWWWMPAVLAAACASATNGEEGEVMEALATSLEAQVQGDSVRLTLAVTNTSERAVSLDFPTGQRYDFVVETEAGEVVWRWSAERMFTQVLGTLELAPGETVIYSEVWRAGDRTGEYVVRGIIPAGDERITQTTEFRIPE